MLGLVQAILLVPHLMDVLQLGASFPARLLDRDGRDSAVPIVANVIVRLTKLGLEWYRTLLILDVLSAVSHLRLESRLIWRCRCLTTWCLLGNGCLGVLVDDGLEVGGFRACGIRRPCMPSRQWNTALLHALVQVLDGLRVTSRIVDGRL